MSDIFDKICDQFQLTIDNDKRETDTSECCKYCRSNCLVKDEGMIVCESCGAMQSIYLDTNQEWRNFGAESKQGDSGARCGDFVNELLPESSLGTLIVGKGFDQLKKMNNWNLMTYRERMLFKIFKQLQQKADIDALPTCVIDRAKIMYKILCDDNIKRSKSRNGLIGACIYYSCKDKNMTLSMNEIAKLFDINPKRITIGCKRFNELMAINNNSYSKTIEPINEFNYIEKYCNRLPEMSEQIKRKIIDLANICKKLNITIDFKPHIIAFTCISFINDEESTNIDLTKIRESAGIGRHTPNKLYKVMEKYRRIILS